MAEDERIELWGPPEGRCKNTEWWNRKCRQRHKGIKKIWSEKGYFSVKGKGTETGQTHIKSNGVKAGDQNGQLKWTKIIQKTGPKEGHWSSE